MGTNGKRASPSSPPGFYRPAPAEINFGLMKFLITHQPNDLNLAEFLDELKKHGARVVVRVCEPSYKTDILTKEGIKVLDWEFSDGSPPPQEVRDKWVGLIKDSFRAEPGSCIAVHCVAGLGRAPVLVALALMEAGMTYEDAVELIRTHRRGAINQKQLSYLEKYKSGGELKKLKNGKSGGNKNCAIM